ncbi:hypothetical protein BT63DRAFT_440398 [Microthyrium microscopicum]|uniref:DUF2470 domain-containing protein n=1 Tax=Microthyrium microscopicum TaxID=703497 RepID=A0A6A6U7F9_9PEZI|nr:hypothetical protein BT63DRAFT_440398 [Microthyrium microscopicum]
MADQAGKDAAIKQRIISHMNKDHYESIALYLENYKGFSRMAAKGAQLSDLTLNDLTIQTSSQRVVLSLDPPMKSLSDSRGRLVDMDKQCRQQLNRSSLTVRTFTYPTIAGWAVFILSIWTIWMLSSVKNIYPGGFHYEYFLKHIPLLPAIAQNLRWPILAFIIVAHTGEAYLMTGRMKHHNVPPFSGLWLAWVVDNWCEGFGAIQRFNALIKEMRVAAESKKH